MQAGNDRLRDVYITLYELRKTAKMYMDASMYIETPGVSGECRACGVNGKHAPGCEFVEIETALRKLVEAE